MIDPDVRNARAIARFERQGFERGPAVVLPEVDLPDVYLPRPCRQTPVCRATPCTLPHCLNGVGGAPTRRTGPRPKYIQYEGRGPALPQPSAGGTPRART
ncbi:hypothetical protein GCM10010300_67120 [Streptomyces olivaceoviridis]|nr:hypothetical protein GCM10010300_67120 [Streptomyces olivaceoviridis]